MFGIFTSPDNSFVSALKVHLAGMRFNERLECGISAASRRYDNLGDALPIGMLNNYHQGQDIEKQWKIRLLRRGK